MAGYSKKLADVVKKYLLSQGWKINFDDEKGVFTLNMSLKCELNTCRIIISVFEDGIISRAISPIDVSEKARPAVSEYLTRANYGLKYGNFEMDLSDGEVRYRSSLVCNDTIPSLDVVEDVVDMPIYMFQRYGDGMLAVMYGGKSPAVAIEEAEAD